MTTQSKTTGRRTAAKRGTKPSKPARSSTGRAAEKRSAPTRARAAKSAPDTTRKSAPKERKQRAPRDARAQHKSAARSASKKPKGLVSTLEQQASRTRDALWHVPQTRAAIERKLPRARRRFLTRAQEAAERGRALLGRLTDMLSGFARQLHLPQLPGRRTA